MMEQPSILVRLVHSVPHINITLHRVNNTFDPKSVIYIEVSFYYQLYLHKFFSIYFVFLFFFCSFSFGSDLN